MSTAPRPAAGTRTLTAALPAAHAAASAATAATAVPAAARHAPPPALHTVAHTAAAAAHADPNRPAELMSPPLVNRGRGDTQIVRRPSFVRVNSQGTPFVVPGNILAEQRQTNMLTWQSMGDYPRHIKSKSPNVINITVTINFTDAAGAIQAISRELPGIWNSGQNQVDPTALGYEHDHHAGPRPPDWTFDEIDAVVQEYSTPAATAAATAAAAAAAPAAAATAAAAPATAATAVATADDPVDAELDRPTNAPFYSAGYVQDYMADRGAAFAASAANAKLSAEPSEKMTASFANFVGAYAHSEVNAAADPTIRPRLREALEPVFAELRAQGATTFNAITTNVDSYPNTVCTNACRPALLDIERCVTEEAVPIADSAGLRISAAFGGGLRATSHHLFQANHNPALRDADAKGTAPHGLPVVLGGAPNLEVMPDGLEDPDAKHAAYSDSKRHVVVAADVVGELRGPLRTVVAAWCASRSAIAGAITTATMSAAIAQVPAADRQALVTAAESVAAVGGRRFDRSGADALLLLAREVAAAPTSAATAATATAAAGTAAAASNAGSEVPDVTMGGTGAAGTAPS